MEASTIFWIFAAVVLAVLESATMSLVSIWFCAGAVAAAITSTFTDSLLWQSGVFVIISALLLIFTRPILKKFIITKATPTNADRIIGKNGVVIIEINPVLNVGQIEINGQVWSAKSDLVIPKGEIVTVNAIEGVKAVVSPNNNLKEEL